MPLQVIRAIGVAGHVVAVGKAVAERTCIVAQAERAVGAGSQAKRHVRLFHGGVLVDVDDHDLGAALLAGADGVGHHIDLGGDGIGAPDHDAIGFGHFAGVRPRELAGACDKAPAKPC
jgi:hypothetical protein